MINDDLLLKIETGLGVSNLLNVHPEILHHSERVTEYIKGFSGYLKLNESTSKRLAEFGSCHDIGKYGVPHSILTKPSKLTVDEFEIMKMHSIYGSQYVESFSDLAYLAPFIRNHHERWDGSAIYQIAKTIYTLREYIRMDEIADKFLIGDRHSKQSFIQYLLPNTERPCSK